MGIFDKLTNRKQDEPKDIIENNSHINKLEDKLFNYVAKYGGNSLNKEELKDFCKLLVEYCKLTRHAKSKLKTPEIIFKKLTEDDTCGYYDCVNNNITINDTYLDEVINKKSKLSDLINSIGHEMTHYHQNSNMIEYDKLSIEQQQLIDEKTKASINSFKNYLDLNEKDVELLHDLIAPYLQKGEIPKGYRKIEDFYSDVSYASYYSIQSEREARTEGVDFTIDFFKKLSDYREKLSDKHLLSSVLSKFNTFRLNREKKFDNKTYDEMKKQYDEFTKTYNLSEEKILEIVEKVEKENLSLKRFNLRNYRVVLRFLIKNKTTEQKESLLKNAIFNGYDRLADIIIESLQNDVDFKLNKNHLSTFVNSCLTGKAYGNAQVNIPHSSYFTDYSKILNQDDFENIVKNTVEMDSNKARIIISFNKEIKTFSLDSLLECQKAICQDKRNSDVLIYGRRFFEALFSQVEIEEKIKYLKSGQLKPEVNEILINCIKDDLRYESFKDEIESLISLNNSEKEIEMF